MAEVSSRAGDSDEHVPAGTRLAGPALPAELRPDGSTEACPCRPTLDRLTDRWSAEIIGVLELGPLCAGQLQRRLPGVSRKVLAQTLRGLQRDGLLTREVLPDPLVRVRYSLTELGLSLTGPLAAIRDWSQQHLPDVARARAAHDQQQPLVGVTELRQRPMPGLGQAHRPTVG